MTEELIYFDANVLLGLYQYPNSVTEAILKVLKEHYDDMVIVPWRASFEYLKNHDGVIKKAGNVNVLTIAKRELNEAYKNIGERIESMLKLKNIEAFNTSFKDEIKKIKKDFESSRNKIFAELSDSIEEYDVDYETSDPVFPFVESHKTLTIPSFNEQIELASRFWTRYSFSIPPGLSDTNKEIDPADPFRKCGDYFIWQEILTNRPKIKKVIFVTAENKKDFWEEKRSNEFSRMLIDEFNENNRGVVFEPLHFGMFLEKYIIPHLTDDIDTIGFLEKNKKLLDRIFVDKDFVDMCFDGIYEMGDSLLDDYVGDSLMCGNITDFYDVCIDDIEVTTDKNDIYLVYEPLKNSITAYFSLRITGNCNIREFLYHDEGEDVDEYHPYATFDIKAEVEAVYRFDGKIILFENFENFVQMAHSIDANDRPDDDLEEIF